MDSVSILSQLNERQAEAVTHTEGPLLVLAGAGAGKTRVIAYRIAYLIQSCGVNPQNILAVTFTNKAANEMKSRLAGLVGAGSRKVWMGTFHSIGLNILRKFGDETVIGDSFSVVDQDDRLVVIKEILKEFEIDPKMYPPKSYLKLISNFKNTMAYVESSQPDEMTHKFRDVFQEYENELRRRKMVDFDDMLSLSLALFLQHPNILMHYRELCKYILVDEYQDTNVIQFAFLRELAGESGNICVVGDDDQSIYGWRGAEVANILFFDLHFKGVKEVKLTDNYRSAPEILRVANRLIRNNAARRGKDLTPCISRAGIITEYQLKDERSEAEQVADIIEKYLKEGIPATEIAVLYRTNAQSRNFEVALSRRKVAYKLVGGVGFYQRREIKDILSYLRLYDNRLDEVSFLRAAKRPPKKIGDASVEKVINYANERGADLIDSIASLIPALPSKQAAGLSSMRDLINDLDSYNKVSAKIDAVIGRTDYREYIITQAEDQEEAKSRLENVYELYNSAVSFEEENPDGTLADFLATATLITSGDELIKNSVRLMTMHAAKGLEFESVFLTGLEEGIFPLLPQDETSNVEEERRLCYVGITRAKHCLNLTHTSSRMLYGKRQFMKPSRFLREMSSISSAKPVVNTKL